MTYREVNPGLTAIAEVLNCMSNSAGEQIAYLNVQLGFINRL